VALEAEGLDDLPAVSLASYVGVRCGEDQGERGGDARGYGRGFHATTIAPPAGSPLRQINNGAIFVTP
jgi:hypothetical protein